ncbi:hypothetical protein [Flavobacterium sp. Root420]|uniref:hypothetical protein n=1 Tax=Flavobacterium sp. Root420 TaxID=1736533 RepID=UPI0006FF0A8A|nr:hypothetical protein [Flavobacterium sp. Root420]KQX00743.1 hypothetical protein ASC72_07705 [Flavobacterium sp. Root420]
MKNLKHIIIAMSIFIAGCTNKKLDAEKATELIKNLNHYPKNLEYEIFCGDPVHAKRMLDAGFEEKGFVSIVKVQETKDIGKPFIVFKDASKPFFLPTSLEDRKHKIQKVKIGDEVFDRIIDLTISSEGKSAIATYITIWNTNIFAVLAPWKKRTYEYKAYFLLIENEWKIVDRKDFEILELKHLLH